MLKSLRQIHFSTENGLRPDCRPIVLYETMFIKYANILFSLRFLTSSEGEHAKERNVCFTRFC